jgi:hypothetical protein
MPSTTNEKSSGTSSAPGVISELVEKFTEHRDAYTGGTYNEVSLRHDFLNPFFEALGWDVTNRQGYSEAYRDVVLEPALHVEASVRAPDYCFRISETPKFFVEAKRPSVDIASDVAPAFQLRRYAWTRKLALSILTDFEEFAVYDCRVKPDQGDKAATARVMLLKYTDYVERWHEIASVFSREAILRGSFDQYAESNKKKRGTAPVDEAFLEEIESWRELLAKNLCLRNDELDDRQLNTAVQLIIDRIIFLRMCEGRRIEEEGRLQALLNGEAVYARLLELFHQADDKYNSGLFHFQHERGREEPDTLTTDLAIDDKVLKQIIRRLYHPCPYEFSAMPADILGQVYEQFLGKVIRITPGHTAKIEEKPEVRKAGGVYYTPTYIVDYIVENTVGKLVEGKTPQEVGGLTATFKESKTAKPLSVLDPACGSGSFLIVAYQYLLDWYLKQYTEAANPQDHARGANPRIYQAPTGDWRLTTTERKRILLAHIYGVDIDYQAVEVTKLSLLLKALEGETKESVQRMLVHKERALPDLAGNIKCGNSLIGSDFYIGKQRDLFDEKEALRINAFDWKSKQGFPKIFSGDNPGFDAVIGNPPYGAQVGGDEVAYLRAIYQTPANSLDTFLLFAERAYQLLQQAGFLGLIIPSGWTSTPSARPLRKLFLENFRPRSFVSLPFDVFGAYIDTVIVTAQKHSGKERDRTDTVDLYVFPQRFKIATQNDFSQFHKTTGYKSWLNSRDMEFLVTCSDEDAAILNKIRNAPYALGHFVAVKRGIETYNPEPNKRKIANPTVAFTGVLQRYVLEHGEKAFISYDDDIKEQKPWQYFSDERILLRQVLSRRLRIQATHTSGAFLTNQSVQSLLLLPNVQPRYSLQFLLALLNSRLLSWYFRNVNSVARRDDFPKIIIKQTRELPICGLDTSTKDGKTRHARVADLVEQLLDLHARLSKAKTDHERTVTQRQIEATDREIDRLVYELYGLTDDEIAIVEQGTK